MVAFNPPVAPSYGADEQVEFKVRATSFGDGYRQRAPDGLNNESVMQVLTWEDIRLDHANQIWTFLKARRGFEAFEYALPGEDETYLWTCAKMSKKRSGPLSVSISATFVREYDL